jgi:hypothetical protein
MHIVDNIDFQSFFIMICRGMIQSREATFKRHELSNVIHVEFGKS